MLQSHKNDTVALHCKSIDKECIKGEFLEKMAQGIEHTKIVIAFITKRYHDKAWYRLQILLLILSEFKRINKPLFPLKSCFQNI